jgi:hypothetical protein
LLGAKIKKAAALRELEYIKRLSQPKVYPMLDANGLYLLAKSRMEKMVPGFALDESNREIFHKLCLYFAGDERCETEYDMSLRKGVMLVGPVGCGKTTLLRAFTSNSFNSFCEVSCRRVTDDYSMPKTGGAEAIAYYSNWKSAFPENFYGIDKIGFLFDDLGTERVKKHYGNEINVMEEIIQNRYDNLNLRGKTHLTTNLSADDIEDLYGSRVRSRLREMCNYIAFDSEAPDRRR